MSTKTTFKRIALVAVAALGLGVLTSVAPASAAITATGITAGTSGPARVGVTSYTTITITHAAMTASGTDTFIAAAKITSVPATSTLKTDTNTATKGVTITSGSTTSAVTTGPNYVAGAVSATITRTASATVGATVSSTFKVGLTPDVAGTYTVLVSVGNTSYTAGDFSVPVTITTVGAPTTLSVAKVAGAVVYGGSNGQLLSVTMKDANGNPTVLAADEGINVTDVDDSIINSNPALAAGEENNAGAYIVAVKPATTTTAITSGTATITFTGTGLLPSTLTTNTTVTLKAAATATTDVATLTTATDSDDETGTTSYTATVKGATSIDIVGHALASTATAATYKLVTVTSLPLKASIATGGNASAAGNEQYIYDDYYTVAIGQLATEASTYTMPAPATSATVTADFGATTVVLSYAAAAAKTLSIVNTTTSVLSATAGTNSFTAKVVDQYGAAVANVAVSVSVSGRNTVASKTLGVTDANGLISYSFTDAGTSGTRDTVAFSATVSGTGTAYAYVNYGTVTVDSVTVSGGSKAETVAGATLTPISAADNGPEASAVSIKAVVKDASGNLLAGVPVVFTVDKGAIVKTTSIDYATVYTGSDGSATTKVFNWVPGTQTITATAGGKSSTDYLTWAATAASSARVLSVSATGDIVTVKVVDRFGNGVKGVSVNLSRTGTGMFGGGSSTQTVVTDKNGTSDVRFSGSGTVVAELDTTTYAQAGDIAGQIAATAVTAAVAGTTKGTGASLAPAGVSKATIAIEESANSTLAAAQSASDAAAEATDAANAATDAANAAAEAADAATAAAQDAADAVAALSTQVSEMIDALKKQITALTNLVIKIQKKVKA